MAKRRKHLVTKCEGFPIRHIGPSSFMADIHHGENRERKCFKTIDEAKVFCKQKKIEIQNQGARAFKLSDKARHEMIEAQKVLGNASILDAAKFYAAHHPSSGSITVLELIEKYLKAPGKRGRNKSVKRRPDSQKGVEWRLKAFARAFGEQNILEITTANIKDWLNSNGWHGLNRRHYLATVTALFNFAIREKYTQINPGTSIEKPDIITDDPEIMTPSQIEKVLIVAEKNKTLAVLVPRLALSFFAGLRPRELDRLDWSDISFENKLVTVGKNVAKVQGQRRTVEMSDNLIKWLSVYIQDKGKVWPFGTTTYARRKNELYDKTNLKMPYNAGRHAFASYHQAKHQNSALTAEMLGHPDATLLKKTYANIKTLDGKTITKKVAEKFWSIFPKREKSAIDFRKAG